MSAAVYITRDGDVLDRIVLAQYGDSTAERMAAVLAANPAVTSPSAVLAAGIRITLPDLDSTTPAETAALWGSGTAEESSESVSASAGSAILIKPQLIEAPKISGDASVPGSILHVDVAPRWADATFAEFTWENAGEEIAGTRNNGMITIRDGYEVGGVRLVASAINGDGRTVRWSNTLPGLAPPQVVGDLPDLDFAQHSGDRQVDASAAIAGAVSWGVSGTGVSISADGVVTHSDDFLADGEVITVVGSNAAGSAAAWYTVTVVQSDASAMVRNADGSVDVTALVVPEFTLLRTPEDGAQVVANG